MSTVLANGDLIDGRYRVERYLAKGGMQYVYIALDETTGRRIALKTPQNASAQKRFRRSAVVAARVNHPNVAKTLDYIEYKGRTFLVEELIEGEDLKSALLTRANFVDPYLAARLFHHLAKAVAAAHHTGVVHRDLKPTNVMIVGGYNVESLKVTDFGVAKMAEAVMEEAIEGGDETLSASATAVGALPYMAPEAIDTPQAVGLPSDIWSLGAMMFHLLCGEFPFGSGLRAVPKIIAAELPETPRFVLQKHQFRPLASEILDIIHECLQKDPKDRPTADALVERCNALCYTVSTRIIGQVYDFRHNAWGFIRGPRGNVFYHKKSVYGPLPVEGDEVVFSSYKSEQSPRALPVLRLERDDQN